MYNCLQPFGLCFAGPLQKFWHANLPLNTHYVPNVMPDTAVRNLKKICLLPAIKALQSFIRKHYDITEYRNREETLQHWQGTWQETAEIANIKLDLEKRNRTRYHLEVLGFCSKVAKHLICFKYSSFGTFFNIVLNFVNRNSPRASLQ